MTLLTTVQGVTPVVGVVTPTSVFSNLQANRTMQEMVALANEMAQRIAWDTRDWQRFTKSQVFAGNGSKTAFDLPADFRRMLKTSEVWSSVTSLYPMRFIPDFNQWIRRRALNTWSPAGEWIIQGGQMLISPAMGTGVTATFPYLHQNCILPRSGGVATTFVDDGDVFALDERVLKLGMIWQWKANKGSPYQEDMATYEDALQKVQGSDKPAPTLIDHVPVSSTARTAYPYPLPTGGSP